MLKGLRRGLKNLGKSKIVRGLGHGIDFVSDFLPPGFRDVGNFGGKLLEGQNLKHAALGTAMDYGMGRIAKGVGGLVGRKAPVSLANKYGADALAKLPVGVTGASAARSGIAGYAPDVISTVASGAGNAVRSGGVGGQVLAGAKRALGGFNAGDLIKGAATGYDIYSSEKDRAYNRKRLSEQDRMYAEDRARSHRLEDESLGRDRAYDAAAQAYFNSNADLRNRGKAGMLDYSRPDLSFLLPARTGTVTPITTPQYATLDPRRRPLR